MKSIARLLAFLGFFSAVSAADEPGIELRPARWFVPDAAPGATVNGRVEVVFSGPVTGAVREASFPRGIGQVRVQAAEPGRRYVIEFDVPAPGPVLPGLVQDTLFITTEPERKEPLALPVSITFLGRLRVVPPFLTIPSQGTATNAAPASRFLLVYPGVDGPFEITRVEWPLEQGSATAAPGRGGLWRIDLKDLPPRPEVKGKFLRIHTSLAGAPVVEIPLYGTHTAQPVSCPVCRSFDHTRHPSPAASTNAPPASVAPPQIVPPGL